MVNPAHYVPPEFRGPILEIDRDALIKGDARAQNQARELLEQLAALRRTNPMQFYEAAGAKHHDFHLAYKPRSIRFLAGGNRAGKTTTGCCDSNIQMIPRALLPEHLLGYKHHDCEIEGPYKLRVVVPDLEQTGAAIHDKFKDWTPIELFKGASYGKAWSEKSHKLQFECGCFMELLSTSMDLDKHGGLARHRVQFDEEPPKDYFTENLLRTTDYGGDILFTMTPLKGLSWIYRDVWKKRDEDHIWATTVGMRDNRWLKPEDVAFVLSLITNEIERRQREFGEFGERGGAVYPTFADAKVPHPPKEFLRYRDVVVVVDPGLRNCGMTWHAFDRDNVDTIFAAALLQRADVGDYCQRIRQINAAWGIEEFDLVVDPAASQGSLTDGRSVIDVFVEHGMNPHTANNAIEAGVGEVRRRLRDGTLKISEALGGLFDEAVEYSEEERDDGVFVPVKNGREHRLDTVRYGVMWRPWHAETLRTQVQGQHVATGPVKAPKPGSSMGALV